MQQRVGRGGYRVDEEAREQDPPGTPAIDQPAYDRQYDGGDCGVKRLGRGKRATAQPEIFRNRFQKHAKSKDIDRTRADQQAADRRKHHPPAIAEQVSHHALPRFNPADGDAAPFVRSLSVLCKRCGSIPDDRRSRAGTWPLVGQCQFIKSEAGQHGPCRGRVSLT